MLVERICAVLDVSVEGAYGVMSRLRLDMTADELASLGESIPSAPVLGACVAAAPRCPRASALSSCRDRGRALRAGRARGRRRGVLLP